MSAQDLHALVAHMSACSTCAVQDGAGSKAACTVTFGQVVGKGQQGGAVGSARLAPEAQHGDLARGAAGVEGNRPRHVLQRDCLFARRWCHDVTPGAGDGLVYQGKCSWIGRCICTRLSGGVEETYSCIEAVQHLRLYGGAQADVDMARAPIERQASPWHTHCWRQQELQAVAQLHQLLPG